MAKLTDLGLSRVMASAAASLGNQAGMAAARSSAAGSNSGGNATGNNLPDALGAEPASCIEDADWGTTPYVSVWFASVICCSATPRLPIGEGATLL